MATFKSLTKKEMKHLKEQLDRPTLTNFKKVAAFQKSLREKPDFQQCDEPCYECKNIARKLGLPI
jgi:hypothetical protein